MKPYPLLPKGKSLASLIASAAISCAGQAADFNIDWQTISSGGLSKGGIYKIGGTIETAARPRIAGGAYELLGGFWTVLMAFQTPGAPELTIDRAGNNVTIAWGQEYTGYILEETSNLNPPTVWQPSIGVGDNSLTVNMTLGPKFYRLRKQ